MSNQLKKTGVLQIISICFSSRYAQGSKSRHFSLPSPWDSATVWDCNL